MKEHQVFIFQVLCKFWFEDDVWNGEAVGLPIAVFGDTCEDADSNMKDAIRSHIQSAIELGDLDAVLEALTRTSKDAKIDVREILNRPAAVRAFSVYKEEDSDTLADVA